MAVDGAPQGASSSGTTAVFSGSSTTTYNANSNHHRPTGDKEKNTFYLGSPTLRSLSLDVDVHVPGGGVTKVTLRGVPRFLVAAFDRLMKDDSLGIQGIFRKEGNSNRLKHLMPVFLGDRSLPADWTTHDVCSAVKRFLRDLRKPLIHGALFEERLFALARSKEALSGQTQPAELARLFGPLPELWSVKRTSSSNATTGGNQHSTGLTRPLPDAHVATLGFIARRLNWIARHSDRHQMTVENLATVLAPSVFSARTSLTSDEPGPSWTSSLTAPTKRKTNKGGSQEDLLDSMRRRTESQIQALKMLIEDAQWVGVAPDYYVASEAQIGTQLDVLGTPRLPRATTRVPSTNGTIRSSSATPHARSPRLEISPRLGEDEVCALPLIDHIPVASSSELRQTKGARLSSGRHSTAGLTNLKTDDNRGARSTSVVKALVGGLFRRQEKIPSTQPPRKFSESSSSSSSSRRASDGAGFLSSSSSSQAAQNHQQPFRHFAKNSAMTGSGSNGGTVTPAKVPIAPRPPPLMGVNGAARASYRKNAGKSENVEAAAAAVAAEDDRQDIAATPLQQSESKLVRQLTPGAATASTPKISTDEADTTATTTTAAEDETILAPHTWRVPEDDPSACAAPSYVVLSVEPEKATSTEVTTTTATRVIALADRDINRRELGTPPPAKKKSNERIERGDAAGDVVKEDKTKTVPKGVENAAPTRLGTPKSQKPRRHTAPVKWQQQQQQLASSNNNNTNVPPARMPTSRHQTSNGIARRASSGRQDRGGLSSTSVSQLRAPVALASRPARTLLHHHQSQGVMATARPASAVLNAADSRRPRAAKSPSPPSKSKAVARRGSGRSPAARLLSSSRISTFVAPPPPSSQDKPVTLDSDGFAVPMAPPPPPRSSSSKLQATKTSSSKAAVARSPTPPSTSRLEEMAPTTTPTKMDEAYEDFAQWGSNADRIMQANSPGGLGRPVSLQGGEVLLRPSVALVRERGLVRKNIELFSAQGGYMAPDKPELLLTRTGSTRSTTSARGGMSSSVDFLGNF